MKGPKPQRNWAAMDPLMRKGGVHRDAKLSLRPRLDKRQALSELDDWRDENNDREGQDREEGSQGPSFLGSVYG